MLSTVLILPTEQVETGNAVADALGFGPQNYSVPLSATGSEPATHWGLHAWAAEAFRDMVESKTYPPALEGHVSQADFDAMMAVLIYSFRADYMGHFDEVCAEHGLKKVELDDSTEQ
jgi:hypothetical protein